MRIAIFLNEELVKEAFLYSSAKTKRDLIELALREFIENHRHGDVRKLKSKIKIDENYNYKKLRKRKILSLKNT